jgi:hypothetical protein
LAEPNSKGDDGSKLTRVGCFLTVLSLAVMLGVAVPIVRWRNPETGRPLPRTVAIASPLLIGAAFHGLGMLLLKIVGLPVWTKPETDESRGPGV